MTQHTSRHYEQELQALKEKILLLGGKVEEMIASAMKSLLNRDPGLARRVIASDREVDAADLERVGDLAVNIAERSIELNEEPPLKPYIDIPRMATAASSMVGRALDAFV